MKKMIGFLEGVTVAVSVLTFMAVLNSAELDQNRNKNYVERTPNENKNSTKNSVEDET